MYFLTIHQETIKKKVLNQIQSEGYSILAIKGKAGTGKTLLTYDIGKEINKSKKVLIIHCGHLNKGQETLNTCTIPIIPAKYFYNIELTDYDLIIVDEAQRMYWFQYEKLVSTVKENSLKCIFSYDKVQTFTKSEARTNLTIEIEKELTHKPYQLTTKIRSNKEIATFIKCMFNTQEIIHKLDYSNVELSYFENRKIAMRYITKKSKENWELINYTPDRHKTLPYESLALDPYGNNAHTVIGQEFDNVLAVIDEYFYYDKTQKLATRNYSSKPYYLPTKMLFQIVSRTKVKLGIVIINNPIILNRCLDIINKSVS